MRSRFPNTGEELVKLDLADFWVCAGDSSGGNSLARHVACMVYSSTGQMSEILQRNIEPGKKMNQKAVVDIKQTIRV